MIFLTQSRDELSLLPTRFFSSCRDLLTIRLSSSFFISLFPPPLLCSFAFDVCEDFLLASGPLLLLMGVLVFWKYLTCDPVSSAYRSTSSSLDCSSSRSSSPSSLLPSSIKISLCLLSDYCLVKCFRNYLGFVNSFASVAFFTL